MGAVRRAVLLTSALCATGALAATMYQVDVGVTSTINEWTVCKKITNNTCGASLMVPTNTAVEWSTFLTNRPACTSVAECAGPPTGLAISHTNNHRDFTVSWSAGSGNGGAGGCKLQYYTGAAWTDLAGSYNCDANASNVAVQLNADNFIASTWNATGLQIRLLRISDSALMGTFGTTLKCSGIVGSAASTPLIDEDCNRQWDNTTTVCNDCSKSLWTYDYKDERYGFGRCDLDPPSATYFDTSAPYPTNAQCQTARSNYDGTFCVMCTSFVDCRFTPTSPCTESIVNYTNDCFECGGVSTYY